MKQEECLVGKMILDNGKLGIIVNEIRQGTWTDAPLFNWTTSYEIKYIDGDLCVMTSGSLDRMIKSGKVVLLDEKQ